jgi:DNA-binding CsgD family transcriptional regulator
MIDHIFLSVIEMIYRAALDPEAWVAFIDDFSKVINLPDGYYNLWDQHLQGVTFPILSSKYSTELQAEAAVYWNSKDELFRRSLKSVGEWLLNNREHNKKYLAKDGYHNDSLFENDIYHVTGYRTANATPVRSAIGLLRGEDQKPLDDSDMVWLKRLVPHFETASHLHRDMLRLKLSANMQEQTLDALDYPTLLVYENSYVAFLNQAAESWLDHNSSICIKLHRLVGSNDHFHGRFEHLLHRVFESGMSGALTIPHSSAAKPYQMAVLPLNPFSKLGSSWQRPLALIVIADPLAKSTLTIDHLQTLFGLTASESRVAIGLAGGKTLEEIADEGNVSINTVRTQVKQALDKTGSRRQAELVKTVNSMPRIRGDSEIG